MTIRVRLFASLRERAGRDELELAGISAPLDVAGLKRALAARHPELGSLAAVRAVLGTAYVAEDTPVVDGATVFLLPPVSGGSGAGATGSGPGPGSDALERGVFELLAGPIDPSECQARVASTSCGAVVLFSGTAREQSRGRTVRHLEYEAFETMTGPEMARIFADARASLDLSEAGAAGLDPARRLRMLVVHREGRVELGQPAVVIAVASPHRDLAFRAARFLIDELKRRLPIWKKEVYEGGEEWIGDRS